jgi:uncharacterized protein (TIGR03089 family)
VTRRTFPALLADQVRRSGSRPLVSFYDDATGERVELSVVTYANWVAKTAGLLQDELDVERGATVLVDLPTHWLGPVWLGAAWSTGIAVTTERELGADADLVVCGPETLGRYAGGTATVVALSLLPMGARFAEPLPAGVVDFGAVVWSQPDSFVPFDPPRPDDVAWRDGVVVQSQEELLGTAEASGLSDFGTRLLTDVNPCSADGATAFLGPLLGGGGTVWVSHPEPDGWERRAEAELATRQLWAQPPRS